LPSSYTYRTMKRRTYRIRQKEERELTMRVEGTPETCMMDHHI